MRNGPNMKKKSVIRIESLVGPLVFYIGLLISVVAAAAYTPSGEFYIVLAVLGVIVGLFNVTAPEVNKFMISSIAFILTAMAMQQMISAEATVTIPTELTRLATNIVVLIGAGVLVIALKAIYEIAKSK